jgi:hypothetical protein
MCKEVYVVDHTGGCYHSRYHHRADNRNFHPKMTNCSLPITIISTIWTIKIQTNMNTSVELKLVRRPTLSTRSQDLGFEKLRLDSMGDPSLASGHTGVRCILDLK